MNQKFVNYFDLGLYKATELKWMVDRILPSLRISNYRAIGFEASKKYAESVSKHCQNNSKVEIHNLAISDTNEKIKLYHSRNQLGHSIFATKNNVSKDKHEEVQGIILSEWIQKNVPNFKESFNILKVNIEGAEWHLFNDLVENDLVKYFSIFCGSGHDVNKIGELSDKVELYWKLLEENSIIIHRFTEWRPEKNVRMENLIWGRMKGV